MKITEQRMEELLPQIIKDSELSLGTKKVLTALLDWYLTTEARNTGIIIINNSKLCAIAGVSPSTLQEAIRDIEEFELGRREVGTGLGNASKYYLNFEAFTKPLKRKSFEELFLSKPDTSKSSETPISTIVKNSIVENSRDKISRVEISKEKINKEEINKEKQSAVEENNPEEKEKTFVEEFEEREGITLNRYLYNLFQTRGIEEVENWYNTNVVYFKDASDFKKYNSIASALNAQAYPIASTFNEVGAKASKKFDKEMAASMRGVEGGFALCNVNELV